jgi:hypothetical protein
MLGFFLQADVPAITADEWWNQKKNADPVLVSMSEAGAASTQVYASYLLPRKGF